MRKGQCSKGVLHLQLGVYVCMCMHVCVHASTCVCVCTCMRACVCAGVGQGAEHLSSRQSSSLPSLRQGVTQEVGWGLGVAAFP